MLGTGRNKSFFMIISLLLDIFVRKGRSVRIYCCIWISIQQFKEIGHQQQCERSVCVLCTSDKEGVGNFLQLIFSWHETWSAIQRWSIHCISNWRQLWGPDIKTVWSEGGGFPPN